MYVEVYWSPLLFNQAPQVENLNFLEFKGPKVQVCNNHRSIEKKKNSLLEAMETLCSSFPLQQSQIH